MSFLSGKDSGSLYLSLKTKSKTLVKSQSLIGTAKNLVLDRVQIK